MHRRLIIVAVLIVFTFLGFAVAETVFPDQSWYAVHSVTETLSGAFFSTRPARLPHYTNSIPAPYLDRDAYGAISAWKRQTIPNDPIVVRLAVEHDGYSRDSLDLSC